VTTVLLVNHDKMALPQYRVQNYTYLHSYLGRHGYDLYVCANGARVSPADPPGFLTFTRLGLASLVRRLDALKPRVCIFIVSLRRPYYFPLLLYLRFRGVKAITWTHGTDLQRSSRLSALVHHAEHELCDGIVLYADHLRKFLAGRHNNKAFVANNTLDLTQYEPGELNRARVLGKYGIHTVRNVIFVGRVQTRKRIHDLLAAFCRLTLEDCGLIIVGPDEDGILKHASNKNARVFSLGPLYGREVLDLLSCADVCCIPGAIGLSIVDAMYCGLPVVTERVAHGPEIMYFHEGENGYMVQEGDVEALAERLGALLGDESLRRRFSQRAREEIATRGHIDNLCMGVLRCLDHVTSAVDTLPGG
jgi:glycosyltransferase involved in cell wall biosynthesis